MLRPQCEGSHGYAIEDPAGVVGWVWRRRIFPETFCSSPTSNDPQVALGPSDLEGAKEVPTLVMDRACSFNLLLPRPRAESQLKAGRHNADQLSIWTPRPSGQLSRHEFPGLLQA